MSRTFIEWKAQPPGGTMCFNAYLIAGTIRYTLQVLGFADAWRVRVFVNLSEIVTEANLPSFERACSRALELACNETEEALRKLQAVKEE